MPITPCILALLTTGAAHAQTMLEGHNGYTATAIFTVGETIDGYTPPGVLDGLGATELDQGTVRVWVNHELRNTLGDDHHLLDGAGGSFPMLGARVSWFDIDKSTRTIVDAGLAIRTAYDATGTQAIDKSFLGNDALGFSRLCSAKYISAGQFGRVGTRIHGLQTDVYFAGEETGGLYNRVGGAAWALDPPSGAIWQLADFGRGAWENTTPIDTGSDTTVAFLLGDDTFPFDADGDGIIEAAPLYRYDGRKVPGGSFLERNGLIGGTLSVFVSDTGERTPEDFHTSGSLRGRWVPIDNLPTGTPSEDGSSGFDERGYPTQGTLWTRAKAVGAFTFSRPEDLATDPQQGHRAVFASTGRELEFNGVDQAGTIYTITNQTGRRAELTILYDGDADPNQAIRSPDNLTWSNDGYIYVQEDEAVSDDLLFGPLATNPEEAGVVQLDPTTGTTLRVATIDRTVVLDASLTTPTDAVDAAAGNLGAWESSGIIDVSTLFGEAPGQLFLLTVQAHGIRNQAMINPASRLIDTDLVEGGQLVFLEAPSPP